MNTDYFYKINIFLLAPWVTVFSVKSTVLFTHFVKVFFHRFEIVNIEKQTTWIEPILDKHRL